MPSLIDHLAQRLGTAPDKAEQALKQFAEHLHERVAQEKDVRLPGLGRFYRRDGALAFEPDEALALAANQRFAGLASVTVDVLQPVAAPPEQASPTPEPHTAAPLSGDSGPVHAPELDVLDQQSDEDGQANEPEETERHWEASDGAGHLLGATSEPLIEDADYSLVDASEGASDVQPPSQPAPEPSAAQESEAPKAAEPQPSSTTAGAKTSARDPKKPKRPLEKSASGSDVRRWLPWAAVAAVIALLALLGVLLLSGDRDTPGDTPPLVAQEDPSETTPPEPASDEAPEEDPLIQNTPATTPDV
ncbi:MAG: HU family DNA-binding protein, partial [Rhodothermales bacterium]